DDALGGGLVDALDGGAQRGVLVLGAGGGDRVLGARAQLGFHGLVAFAVNDVLLVALDLALDIGHGVLVRCAACRRRAEQGYQSSSAVLFTAVRLRPGGSLSGPWPLPRRP